MLSSCKVNKKELVEIQHVSNEFKLEFLNEILSDTSETRYFKSKVQLVSNFAYIRFHEGSDGQTVLFERKNGKWKFLKEISSWVE